MIERAKGKKVTRAQRLVPSPDLLCLRPDFILVQESPFLQIDVSNDFFDVVCLVGGGHDWLLSSKCEILGNGFVVVRSCVGSALCSTHTLFTPLLVS